MKTNNELIAEFRGAKFKDCGDGIKIAEVEKSFCPNQTTTVDVWSLKYHVSWDWLMPVVEMIETTIWNFPETMNSLTIKRGISSAEVFPFEFYDHRIKKWTYYLELEKTSLRFGQSQESDTKIEAVYKAVVLFIKWHNKIITTLT